MMLLVVKFFHIICGISFLGIIIATFFYTARSINKADRSLICYSIKVSYFGDIVILLCVLIQIASALVLVTAGGFTIRIPWIFVAYHAFGFLVVLWLLNILIKKVYLSRSTMTYYPIQSFYFLNVIMILTFIIIIHDAVAKSTWLEFLFRK